MEYRIKIAKYNKSLRDKTIADLDEKYRFQGNYLHKDVWSNTSTRTLGDVIPRRKLFTAPRQIEPEPISAPTITGQFFAKDVTTSVVEFTPQEAAMQFNKKKKSKKRKRD